MVVDCERIQLKSFAPSETFPPNLYPRPSEAHMYIVCKPKEEGPLPSYRQVSDSICFHSTAIAVTQHWCCCDSVTAKECTQRWGLPSQQSAQVPVAMTKCSCFFISSLPWLVSWLGSQKEHSFSTVAVQHDNLLKLCTVSWNMALGRPVNHALMTNFEREHKGSKQWPEPILEPTCLCKAWCVHTRVWYD